MPKEEKTQVVGGVLKASIVEQTGLGWKVVELEGKRRGHFW